MTWSWSSFFEYVLSPYILAGVWTTVWLSCASMAIGIVLGTGAALMRMARNFVPSAIAAFYIWLWRGTPLLVQLVIIYTGLPQFGIRLGVVESALLGFGLNEGAYFAEVVRAGITSVDVGQRDAARALGLNSTQIMAQVVLPQAARVVLPPLGNQFNGMLKASSLASVISMEELLRHAQQLAQIEFRVLEAYLAAGAVLRAPDDGMGVRAEPARDLCRQALRKDGTLGASGIVRGNRDDGVSEDLLFMPATRAASLIRRRRLSPVEYVGAVLRAAEASQARINAFVTITADAAREVARSAEDAVMRGDRLGPLHGVPVHIKDLYATRGVRTSYGSAIHAADVPDADDVLVERLKTAGAIVIGKTTTPEFGHKGLTDGPAFGITRNPWNPERTPGGSSGGAAAAVAAGVGPIGLGSDGAGSVRIPAACCGLVGLKPTQGAVPGEATTDGFGTNVTADPIARTVADAALMQAVIAGPDPRDPWSLGSPAFGRVSPALLANSLDGLRVGFLTRAGNAVVGQEALAAARRTAAVLEGLGAAVEDIVLPVDWIEEDGRVLYMGSIFAAFAKYLPEWGARMDPILLGFIEQGRMVSLTRFREAQAARSRLFRAVQGLFAGYDVLVSPTLTRGALPVGFRPGFDEVEVDGVACGTTRQGWSSYMYPFNLTGHPAVTVPSGFDRDGLPLGTQIVGRWHADADIMRLAAMIEAASPWSEHRPPC